MSRSLATLVLLALVLAPIHATGDPWTATLAKVTASVVYIEGNDGACSGFVIDAPHKLVMTAAHCDMTTDGHAMWVDRVRATVVSKDTKEDLLIVAVPLLDPARPALTLAAHNPTTGEEVASVGYGYALERPFARLAHVSDTAVSIPEIGGPFIGVDSGYVEGQSGGPVVNLKGEVVSIVQRASDKLGIGVGAETIRARMGRFWGVQ